jgi:hypothetical protein
MKSYIVTFETSSDASRNKLRDEMKKFGSYCPIHKYCWAIVTDKSAKEIRDFLSPNLANDERIFVVRSGTEAAWRNSYGEKHNEWLKENL